MDKKKVIDCPNEWYLFRSCPQFLASHVNSEINVD